MINKIKNILLNNRMLVLADQAVFSGSSFLATILLARILGPENFGVYAAIMLFVYMMVSVLNAQIIQPLQVTYAKIDNKSEYISFTFFAQLVLILLTVIISFVVFQIDIQSIKQYSQLKKPIIILCSTFLLHDYFRKLFLAQAQIFHALIIDTIVAVFQFLVLISAMCFVEIGLFNIVTLMGVVYIPSIIVAIIFIKPNFKRTKYWKGFLKMHIMQAKWLLLTAIVQWWSSNLFVVASGVFLGVKALGAFRLVQSLFGVLNVLLQTFENYALPQTSKALIVSKSAAKSYLRQISIKSAAIFAVILFITFFFSEFIITLAGGAEYSQYAFVVKGMSVLYALIFIGYPVRMAIRVLVLNKSFFVGYVFALIFSLVSFNYFLENWHLMGAIAGLVGAQIILISYWQFVLAKNKFILWK